MKYYLFIIISFFSVDTFSQSTKILVDQATVICFINYKSETEQDTFNIVKTGSNYTVYDKFKNSREVGNDKVSAFKNAVSNNIEINSFLKHLKIDSLSWMNKFDSIWRKNYHYKNKEINLYALSKLSNYGLLKKEFIGAVTNNNWERFSPYPFTILFINPPDTTYWIRSSNYYPYALPWETEYREFLLNPDITKTLTEIIWQDPKILDQSSRYDRVNQTALELFYDSYLKDSVEEMSFIDQFPITYRKAKKHFEILYCGHNLMASIDWGGEMGMFCVEMTLHNSKYPRNVNLEVVLGDQFGVFPIDHLIASQNKILKRLRDNPVHSYVSEHPDSMKGDIHFVNNKSFSDYGHKWLKEDCGSRGIPTYGTIFYDVSELHNGKWEYSRWLFLRDGRIFLWDYKGEFILNKKVEMVKVPTSICKFIEWSDFMK